MTIARRACLGFVTGAVSVLVFHQGMWALLHAIGQMPSPYPTEPVGRLGIPRIYDMSFWGGVWGIAFGLVYPYLPARRMWLQGLALGLLAELGTLFVVPALKGLPLADGGSAGFIVHSLLINGTWGIGVGVFAPLLMHPRRERASGYAAP
jgi:hypothetical protein